jgi:hypothetical protein
MKLHDHIDQLISTHGPHNVALMTISKMTQLEVHLLLEAALRSGHGAMSSLLRDGMSRVAQGEEQKR